MTKNTIIILLTTILLLVAAAVIGYYFFNKGPVNIEKSKGIEATSNELYTSYTKDPEGARKKYDGKVIKVTGLISDILENTQKQQVILLKTSNPGGNINCTMEVFDANFKQGNIAIIKGVCHGLGQGDPDVGILGDVYVTRSVISN